LLMWKKSCHSSRCGWSRLNVHGSLMAFAFQASKFLPPLGKCIFTAACGR